MTNKTTLKRLKLDPYFNKTIDTNLNVWSHDQNSFEIKFEFYDHECDKPIDLTGADMRILLDHADSQPKVYPLEIESKMLGLAKFVMPKEIRGCEGKFTAHIYADYPNKTHDFGSFIFYTQLSRIDKGMGGCLDTVYVSEFEKALKEIKDKNSQFDNVESKLNARIDVIEKDIESNEIAKKIQVEKLEKDVKKLDFLSENKYIGTQKFSSDKWNNYSLWQKEGTFGDFSVMKRTGQWAGLSQSVNVETGDIYTFSAYVKSDELADVGFYANYSGSVVSEHEKKIKTTSEWSWVSVTFTIINGGTIRPRFENNTAGSNLYLAGIKLDRNNKVTKWSPNLLDLAYQHNINDLQKQIDDLKKAITTLGGTL